MKYAAQFLGLAVLTFVVLLTISGCSMLKDPLSSYIDSSNDVSVLTCEASECHGATPIGHYPPETGKHSQHLNSVNNSNILCLDCHYSYNGNPLHKNGIINGYNSLINDQADGSIIFFKTDTNPSGSWDNASGTCSNMNCHGPLDWYGTYAIEDLPCTTCHGPGTLYAAPDSGSHTVHINAGSVCADCHYDYTTGLAHNDGTPDTSGIIFFETGGTWDDGASTCSSISCHGGGAPVWGAGTLECADCHTPAPSTNSHTPHLTAGSECSQCHYNYRIADSHVDGTDDTTGIVAFESGGTWDDGLLTCTSVHCHLNGVPQWDDSGPLACGDCHTPDPSTGSHTAHLVKSLTCEQCHNNYKNSGTHVDGNLNTVNIVNFESGGDWADTVSECSVCCHGGGTPKWGGTSITCRNCHVSDDEAYDPVKRDLSSGGRHSEHLNTAHGDFTGSMDCEICHYDYKDSPSHVDCEWTDGSTTSLVSFDTAASTYPYPGSGAGWLYSTCSNMNCHGNVSWYTIADPPLTCDNCHGSDYSSYNPDPVGDLQGTHDKHVQQKNYPCTHCHYGYKDEGTHLNGTLNTDDDSVNQVTFNPGIDHDLIWDDSNNSCSRSGSENDCHDNPGGSWSVKIW